MLLELTRGQPKKPVIMALARKFHVKPNTLYQDWSRRQRWAPSTLTKEQRVELGTYVVLHHEAIRHAAYRAYRQAMKQNNLCWALGCLDVLLKNVVQEVKALQTLGFLPCVHKLR